MVVVGVETGREPQDPSDEEPRCRGDESQAVAF